MPRVVSLFLPTWPTDRARKTGQVASPPGSPLVTALKQGARREVAATDEAARSLGLRPGMTVAHAQALVPNLAVAEARPGADAQALTELALWCLRYAPVVAPDPPGGVLIDITGAAHLHAGGECALLADLARRCARAGYAAHAAVADTPGAAWAVARYGAGEAGTAIVPVGRSGDAIAGLPVEALRLPPDVVQGLRGAGIERVAQVAAMPSAPLARRFGPEVARRLGQALGHVPEPVTPLKPPSLPMAKLVFAEPVGKSEDLHGIAAHLAGKLCADLERRGLGARRLDLMFVRVDGAPQAVCIGTSRASRDPVHLARLLRERIETVDPGFGIERAILTAPRVEPLAPEQLATLGSEGRGRGGNADLALLVDRLGVRRELKRLYRMAPVESDVPERSARRIPALSPPQGASWPAWLPRPVRLITPPEPVVATALLPDEPPAWFMRGRRRHVVRHADGPERVYGEWWRSDDEIASVRDYYRLEDEEGCRFWLFRDGETNEVTRWWLHGLFE